MEDLDWNVIIGLGSMLGGVILGRLVPYLLTRKIVKEHEEKRREYVDIPRTENGWPTIAPSEFTDEQLAAEAKKWAHMRGSNYVGGAEFDKYDRELVSRGLNIDWSNIPRDWD